jgi:hypothetical protein
MELNMPVYRFVLFTALSFLVGVFSAQTLARHKEGPIPDGVWISLWTGNLSSIQLNISKAELGSRSVTTWIREDRQVPFLGKSGVFGKTILSHATIDCTSGMVAIHEQRSFDGYMGLIMTEQVNEPPGEPTDLGMMISRLMLCGTGVDKSDTQKQKYVQV